jgi:hypothetical protein
MGYLPEVSPAYLRGYRDGHEAAREEIKGTDTQEKRLVLCPGYVTDEDGKQVYVSAPKLAYLYGVSLDACYVDIGRTSICKCHEGPRVYERRADDVLLVPREDGRYPALSGDDHNADALGLAPPGGE